MILGDGDQTGANLATLDDLFRRSGVRRPDALALVDPPNRSTFTGGASRSLTFAETDRAVSCLATRLRELGLYSDTVVAIQLGNTVESVIALLGVLRAGMIAVPVPLLWRQKDMIEALGRVGAKAIITTSRIGACAHAEIAMQVAAELFPIRYVCGFGGDFNDGVVPLDDVFAADASDLATPGGRVGNPAAHIAVVTFDVGMDGLVPVARSHSELIAGGLSICRESDLSPDAPILSTIPLGSFAGLSLTLVPWLLTGGPLHLHHGFDAETFAMQYGSVNGGAVMLPGPTLEPLSDAGQLNAATTIVALWRAPERLASGTPWSGPGSLVDVSSFGEVGHIAGRRAQDGIPAPIPCGPVTNPHGSAAAAVNAETMSTKANTLALRGPMVSVSAFPPGANEPQLTADDDGFVDTGFSCRLDRNMRTLGISGPPGGFAGIGGYRLSLHELENLVAVADTAATIVALPDALLGQRLAASAPDREAVQTELQACGVNPLIIAAFRARKPNAT